MERIAFKGITWRKMYGLWLVVMSNVCLYCKYIASIPMVKQEDNT